MACPRCDHLAMSVRELTDANALLASMLRELLDEVQVTLETAGVEVESPHPVR